MAKAGEEEEYESDPEEGKRLLGMRRRMAASDDEEEEGSGEEEKRRVDHRAPIHSEDESDGQGGVDYDEEDEEEEVYEDEEVYEEGAGRYEEEKVEGVEGGVVEEKEDGRKLVEREEGGSQELDHVEDGHNGEEGEENGKQEKKENEPFAVPTAGAFYMHDDRFRENAGGRNRRTYGGRKLWESKDDQKWGHDKFEEMSVHDRNYWQGRRGGRGSYRGRGGKTRGVDRGYNRRSIPQPFSNGDNQAEAPKGVKGRGSRKYEHMIRNISHTPPMSNKQPAKAPEKTSITSYGEVVQRTLRVELDQAPPSRKHSGLSYSSPPFYPSGSSNKDFTATQKREVPAGNRRLPTPVVDESFHMPQSNVLMRGKNLAESVGFNKLYIDDRTVNGKPLKSAQLPSSGSTLVNAMQPGRGQGRASAITGPMTYQSVSDQANCVSATVQLQGTQRTAQSRIQPPVQPSSQQFSQHSAGGSRPSSSPTDLSISPYEPKETDTNSDSGKSRTALVAKGKGSLQGSGRGSFIYGGAQVLRAAGNMGASHGDQNFHTFLPVMQFGGQHPGGIGVPAVGMAFPGYVGQPQHGPGNSEMTWLPVLTGAAGTLGAAGSLGASYCSPYLAIDSNYCPSVQTSSHGSSSKEGAVIKSNNNWKPTPRSEIGNDDPGQHQKGRRYSEMDFKQASSST